MFHALWPRASQAKIDAIVEIAPEVFAEHVIDDPHVVAQLMANISHECGGGTIVRESGNYSAARIVEIFGSPKSSAAVTAQEAQTLAHNTNLLFERVYNLPLSPKLAKELGNHEPGDGPKYRGGGDLQLTGRASYDRIGKLTGHPEILENPDLLADPKISFKVAVAEFVALGCVKPAKERNTVLVRRKVNGGTNGLAEVTVWVRKWETALPDIEPKAEAIAPRGSDSGEKTLTDSTIIKGSIGTAVATVGTVASQVATVSQQASDTIGTVQTTAGMVTTVVKAVKPIFGLMPEIWIGIGIACGVMALVGCAYVMWRRWAKLRDEGV
jgi:putative chitinase